MKASLLDVKIELASRILESCELCERRCKANRAAGQAGHCGVLEPRISSEFMHLGEEPELVPSYTIFFAGCTFNCVFCQNFDISQRPKSGRPFSPREVAGWLEKRSGDARSSELDDDSASRLAYLIGGGMGGKARNANWVGGDPTSNLHFILSVLRESDAWLAQVWNSNMYLTEEAMRLLDGVIDVYLTDFKYGPGDCGKRLSNAGDYWGIVARNHLLARANGEMIIRHLVLPNHVECCSKPVLSWIAESLPHVKVNVMSQYRPEYRADEHSDIACGLSREEYREALAFAKTLGLDLTN